MIIFLVVRLWRNLCEHLFLLRVPTPSCDEISVQLLRRGRGGEGKRKKVSTNGKVFDGDDDDDDRITPSAGQGLRFLSKDLSVLTRLILSDERRRKHQDEFPKIYYMIIPTTQRSDATDRQSRSSPGET